MYVHVHACTCACDQRGQYPNVWLECMHDCDEKRCGGECKYGRSDCSFVGHIVSGNGMMNVICSFPFVHSLKSQ